MILEVLSVLHVIFLLLEHEEEMNLKTHRTPTYLIYDPLHTSYCEYLEYDIWFRGNIF